ncbi:MAG: hypothetical protein GQ534_02645 [Candidatus Delongbacteria bacterium]|nr:hypothetical protein [Candidatus Delongbacteria bacterium]
MDDIQKLSVSWIKCKSGKWYGFETVDLNSDHFKNLKGVYIIWVDNKDKTVVRLGQGDIAVRLKDHRNTSEITDFNKEGKLLTTWTNIEDENLGGVEAFLADKLEPKIGERFPDEEPIEVNLPER